MIAILAATAGDGSYDAFAVQTDSTLVHLTGATMDMDEAVKLVESNLVPIGA